MKIAFFPCNVPKGPIVRNNLKIIKFLKGRLSGITRFQFVCQDDSKEFDASTFSDVEIIGLDSERERDLFHRYFRYVRIERPDIVVAVTTWPAIVALTTRFFLRSKERILISNHTMISEWLRMREGKLSYLFLRVCMVLFCRWSDWVTSVSEESARDLERFSVMSLGSTDVRLNPTYEDSILVKASEENKHKWFSERKQVIVTAARLEEEKDLSTLLKAFQRVRKKLDVYLIVLGKGPLSEELKAEACELGVKDWVDFVGFQENPFSYFSRASVFVLSSRFEGLPNVLIEALACNCPCVATKCCGGSKEILGNGRYGELVEVGDDTGMAEAIEKQLREPNRNELQARAREFSVEQTQTEFLSRIQQWMT